MNCCPASRRRSKRKRKEVLKRQGNEERDLDPSGEKEERKCVSCCRHVVLLY